MRAKPLLIVVSAVFVMVVFISSNIFCQEHISLPDIYIKDAVICKDLDNREPVEPGDVFQNNLKNLFCFSRIMGAKEDIKIKHNWYFEDKLVASVPLHVGSINWRTFSSKRMLPQYTGEWRVEIISYDGTLLKKISFVLE